MQANTVLPKVPNAETGKSAIVIVTYNKAPEFAIFEEAADSVDYIIICDNSSDPDVIKDLSSYCQRHSKYIYLQNNANLGFQKPTTKPSHMPTARCLLLYFFDDDANFDIEWLSAAKKAWLELEEQNNPVGLLVPIITNDKEYMHSTLGFRGRYSVIASAITSGILTTIDAFSRCGGYNTDYFVDWADLELCRRMQQSGRLVVRLNKVLIYQAFGRNLRNVNLRNRLITPTSSPLRC
jgi:rhamnosyltransferase